MGKFKRGDVVVLNSDHSMLMTVAGFSGGGSVEPAWVTTEWFDYRGQVQRRDFHVDMLSLVEYEDDDVDGGKF